MSGPAETFKRALDELAQARRDGDRLGVRQAAEKAWLAVVEAADFYLAAKHNVRVTTDETAHAERRRFLRNLNHGDLETSYGHLSQTLHGDIFYFDEPIEPGSLRSYLEEAAEFVERTTGEAGLRAAVWRCLSTN